MTSFRTTRNWNTGLRRLQLSSCWRIPLRLGLQQNLSLLKQEDKNKNEPTSKRLNLKHLDTRLTDKQIDEVIEGLQKDFDCDLKERKKREQQLDDYKMTAFMLIVSTALAVVTIG